MSKTKQKKTKVEETTEKKTIKQVPVKTGDQIYGANVSSVRKSTAVLKNDVNLISERYRTEIDILETKSVDMLKTRAISEANEALKDAITEARKAIINLSMTAETLEREVLDELENSKLRSNVIKHISSEKSE